METTETHRAIEAVWRIESARLIAGLTRIIRDVGRAEELAQDALVAALEQWPESGVPDNPGAWLMATAKHRAIDHFRRSHSSTKSMRNLGAISPSGKTLCPTWLRPSMTTSETTCCAWCLLHAILCSRLKRGLRSRCDCSAD